MATSSGYCEQSAELSSSINPLKPKIVEIIFKNSVRTAKKTNIYHHKEQFLKAVKEIIAVYSENHTKSINTK
jgi:hypothetical protein